jgi:hypothetical protein
VSPVRYQLGFYIPEDAILHSHRRENLKSYKEIYICKSHVLRSSSLAHGYDMVFVPGFLCDLEVSGIESLCLYF